ncbi:MAG TPA: biotin--[acetyl-CoA-carboxylase] ligase [Actinomycetota bacterium]|nr:biotin--[acetyl-CoA-carboxylase] ligase [Actinomycetota bacterium]
MLTEHSVEEAARGAGVSAPVHFLPVTGSTNADLLRLAAQGAPEWTVVVAGHQEAGRGRLGRSWFSTEGASLLVSVLLRPSLAPEDAPLLTLLGGLAAAEACRAACGVDARCKWPNDLVVRERKLGGVLVEAGVRGGSVQHVVVGLGVNVAQRPDDFPRDLRPLATSVAMEGGRADPVSLLRAFLAELGARYRADGANLRAEVLPAYRAVCATVDREVRALTTSGGTVEGRAVGVGDQGELLVATAAGVAAVRFGEVAHVEAP